ncbi:MAG: reverse transcriptase domain-containing protein, partial [Bacteroidota bacterium]
GGTEAVVHSVRLWAEMEEQEGRSIGVVKTDLANCFNTLPRDLCRRLLFHHAREFVPLFDCLYLDGSLMIASVDVVVTATSGTVQGCPLGPLLCALVVVEAMRIVKVEHPDVNCLAIMDDTNIFGDPVQVAEAAHTYCNVLSRLAPEVEVSKVFGFRVLQPERSMNDVNLNSLPANGQWLDSEDSLNLLSVLTLRRQTVGVQQESTIRLAPSSRSLLRELAKQAPHAATFFLRTSIRRGLRIGCGAYPRHGLKRQQRSMITSSNRSCSI